ncbi:MAG: hypothetical protein VW582_12795 [Rhodospirillaceae bacterium]
MFTHPWLAFDVRQSHLGRMMKMMRTPSPGARRPLLVGIALLSFLALAACAGTPDGGKNQLEAPGFDPQIGGE